MKNHEMFLFLFNFHKIYVIPISPIVWCVRLMPQNHKYMLSVNKKCIDGNNNEHISWLDVHMHITTCKCSVLWSWMVSDQRPEKLFVCWRNLKTANKIQMHQLWAMDHPKVQAVKIFTYRILLYIQWLVSHLRNARKIRMDLDAIHQIFKTQSTCTGELFTKNFNPWSFHSSCYSLIKQFKLMFTMLVNHYYASRSEWVHRGYSLD